MIHKVELTKGEPYSIFKSTSMRGLLIYAQVLTKEEEKDNNKEKKH